MVVWIGSERDTFAGRLPDCWDRDIHVVEWFNWKKQTLNRFEWKNVWEFHSRGMMRRPQFFQKDWCQLFINKWITCNFSTFKNLLIWQRASVVILFLFSSSSFGYPFNRWALLSSVVVTNSVFHIFIFVLLYITTLTRRGSPLKKVIKNVRKWIASFSRVIRRACRFIIHNARTCSFEEDQTHVAVRNAKLNRSPLTQSNTRARTVD